MKKNKISNKTIALFAAAMVLLAGGTFTGTQAVLNIFSPEHFLEFDTSNQAVRLLENGSPVGADNPLLSSLSGKVEPGKTYTEEIAAKNNSDVGQFVRIVVRKYWMKPDPTDKSKYIKVTDLEEDEKGNVPDLDKIDLQFTNGTMWLENKQEKTAERRVFYYKNMVPAGSDAERTTVPLTSKIAVDKSVADAVTVTGPDDKGIITYTYKYNGYQVCLEAEAQSIQTHNVTGEHNAIRSIWGVDNVTSDGTTLKVN